MDRPLTVAEVAERLGVSESLVYALVSEKRLKAMRLGRQGKRGKILVPEDQLQAFVEGCTEELSDD